MTTGEASDRLRLREIERELAELTAEHHAEQSRLEGARDELLHRLLDLTDADSSRWVGVR